MPAGVVYQHRRGTAAGWTSTNPTLANGELGFETDTKLLKLGDGATAWASLAYIPYVDTSSTQTVGGAKSFTSRILVGTSSKLGAYTQTSTALTLSTSSHKYVEITASGVTITLPTATNNTGFDFYITNVSTGSITLAANGTQTIGNTASAASTLTVTSGSTVHVVSNGTGWRML